MIVQVSTTGNDANDGIAQPVKTLKRGIGIALANGEIATVSVAAGRYDAANGETFPYTVPGGITIEGPAGGGAILAGSGIEPGLSLESGTLANLEFESFAVAVTATGTGHIGGARVRTSALAIRAETAAQLAIDSLDITGPTAGCKIGIELDGGASLVATNVRTGMLATAIVAKDQSTVMLGGGMIAGDASCTNLANVDIESTGSVAVSDTLIDGGAFGMFFPVDGPATAVTLTNTTIRNLTGDGLGGRAVNLTMIGGALTNSQDGMQASGGTWSFTNVMITGHRGLGIYIQGTAANAIATLTMRGSTLSQNAIGIDVFDFAVADFGTVASPGGNNFSGNTEDGVDIDGNFGAQLINAVGNTWRPNVQGADAQGHYTVATIPGPVAFASGNNFVLGSGWSLQR